MRMLVVEDDPLIREMVVEHLQEQGFDVRKAADGKEALSWCKRRKADALVTDVVLPGGIDGWQIAELAAGCLGYVPSCKAENRLSANHRSKCSSIQSRRFFTQRSSPPPPPTSSASAPVTMTAEEVRTLIDA